MSFKSVTKMLAVGTFLSIGAGHANAVPITLSNATATYSDAGFLVGAAIDFNPVSSGWAVNTQKAYQVAVFETAPGTYTSGDFEFQVSQFFTTAPQGPQGLIGRFRLSATTDARSTFADGLSTGGDVTANWTVLDIYSMSSLFGSTMTQLADKSILLSGTTGPIDAYTLVTDAIANTTGFRLEVFTDPSLPAGGPGRQPATGNFVLSDFHVEAIPEPGTLLLVGLGLTGFAFVRRRQRL